MTIAPDLLSSLKWRRIGPYRGGRVVAAAGDPSDPMTFYFGACAGGVWKTTDGGTYWENVSDGFFNTAAVGAIAVSDSDPNVISATQADLDEQHALFIRARDKLSECHDAINQIIRVRRQVDEWVRRSEGHGGHQGVSGAAGALKDKLSAIEDELIQLKAVGDLDTISQPAGLNAKLAEITFVPSQADYAPTAQSHDVFQDLSARTDTQMQRLNEVIEQDLPAFVNVLHELEIPVISPGGTD